MSPFNGKALTRPGVHDELHFQRELVKNWLKFRAGEEVEILVCAAVDPMSHAYQSLLQMPDGSWRASTVRNITNEFAINVGHGDWVNLDVDPRILRHPSKEDDDFDMNLLNEVAAKLLLS